MKQSIHIGFDPREANGFAVTRRSTRRQLTLPIPTSGLVLADLKARGLYTRPTSRRDGRLWDDISDAPMATEFACSRFLVPYLNNYDGWAIFMDCDMLVRTNLVRLFRQCDLSKAVMVVKHDHQPTADVKMDGQVQTRYARKNWSSLMVFNCGHPSNKALTVDLVNSVPGRDLHAFCWLKDHEIGALDQSWNYLVGHSSPEITPDIVHFTDGLPSLPGYEDCEYADEWRAELSRWAA
ncbi:UNVERIFIED_ORG: hypothetical protein M2435_001265 [Rhizobium sophorae]|uniref:hypothetical protein n=1 Tax=Rhizobium leguminosarum TaxID=384 RepID=UPI00161F1537|nr:hypothetical protein [Rhizobium leguminosarum]MBB4520485.1 hypothetical protein [Rhizobium leguminosarum]MDH6658366.1 hypothetical protein [Rhizobium sophorae]